MAKYTVEVRHVCEEKAGLSEAVGFNDIDQVLEDSWDKIFTTDVEFFDEAYRAPLCKKILKHFWMREIGFETVGQWQYYLNKELEEQMPMFNQLYKSTLLKYPIFNNMHIKTEHTTEDTGETTSDTDTNENSGYTTDGTKGVTTYGDEDATKDSTNNMTGSGTDDLEHKGTENVTGSETVDTGKSGSKSTSENTTGSSTDSKTNTHNDTTTTDATKTYTDENWDEYSDTPQGGLNNIKSGYDSTDYLTDIRKKTDDSTEKLNETVQNNGGYTENGQGSTTGNKTGSENWSETDNVSESSRQDTTDSYTNNEQYTKKQDDTYGEKDHKEYRDQQDTVYHEEHKAEREEVYNAVGSSHDLEEFVEFTRGKTGTETFAEMLLKFRDTFRNLDMELINKFEDLFMQLW